MSKKKKDSTYEVIGEISVDAGLVYIGDPCYQSEDRCDFSDWSKFCNTLDNENFRKEGFLVLEHQPGNPHKGIISTTYYGDGLYPVIAEKDKNGRIRSITIDFDPIDVEDLFDEE